MECFLCVCVWEREWGSAIDWHSVAPEGIWISDQPLPLSPSVSAQSGMLLLRSACPSTPTLLPSPPPFISSLPLPVLQLNPTWPFLRLHTLSCWQQYHYFASYSLPLFTFPFFFISAFFLSFFTLPSVCFSLHTISPFQPSAPFLLSFLPPEVHDSFWIQISQLY